MEFPLATSCHIRTPQTVQRTLDPILFFCFIFLKQGVVSSQLLCFVSVFFGFPHMGRLVKRKRCVQRMWPSKQQASIALARYFNVHAHRERTAPRVVWHQSPFVLVAYHLSGFYFFFQRKTSRKWSWVIKWIKRVNHLFSSGVGENYTESGPTPRTNSDYNTVKRNLGWVPHLNWIFETSTKLVDVSNKNKSTFIDLKNDVSSTTRGTAIYAIIFVYDYELSYLGVYLPNPRMPVAPRASSWERNFSAHRREEGPKTQECTVKNTDDY